MMSNEEEKSTKTIRDYPINQISPFNPKVGNVTEDRSFSVGIIPKDEKETLFTLNLTGIHVIDSINALELIGDILKDKLHMKTGGINVFKYMFGKLEKIDEAHSMTFKIDFDDCKDACGYTSHQSVWYGLAELLEKDIIARSGVPAVYYLNPNYFQPATTIVVTEFYKIKD
jgi:hypothetical protein